MKDNNPRYLAYKAIYEVMYKHGYSNLVLQDDVMNELNDKDKGLVTSIVYGTIQNYNLLEYQLTQVEYQKINNKQLVIILIALYQRHFLDKIPTYAIVDESIKLAKKVLGSYDSKFISALLNKLIESPLLYANSVDEMLNLSINYSHPLWFVKMIKKQYDEETLIKILKANNQPARVHLRYNILSNKYDELLADSNIEVSDIVSSGLYYNNKNIAGFKPYIDGEVSVQDFSSQQVALFASPKAGMKVLDMCAAPGTKTSHLAELMHNEGLIKAYDLYEHKIPLINKQALRLHLDIITAKAYDATKLSEIEADESFDLILCDAPCTGLGVIKRKPEIKYQYISTSMDEIIKIQQELLNQAYSLLKVGGTLVYSTCTINKKENEKQIDELLNKHQDLELVASKLIHNYEVNGDGFYMAKLIKNKAFSN